MLVNLKRQLLDRSINIPMGAPNPAVTDAPKSKRFHDPISYGGPASPTLKRRRPLDVEDVDMEDVESQSLSSSVASSSPISSGTDSANEKSARRTSTETLVADFMVTLLTGMACLVQLLVRNSLCIANSYESTFQFGSVCGTGKQSGSNSVQFRARIDGSIPFSVTSEKTTSREVIIFEAKRAPRADRDVSVLTQQSLEHAIYIWERHKNDVLVMSSVSIYFREQQKLASN